MIAIMPNAHWMERSMFSTRKLTADLVQLADAPACLSTAGVSGSRYLSANAGYLRLIERVWPEIQGKELLATGSALSSAQRDRRQWLLETNGYYDAEPAELRSATGRIIAVEISSQRVWCSGVACDLEYFMPLPPERAPLSGAGPSVTSSRRACFTPRFSDSLTSMSGLNRHILLGRILSLAAEGAMLARHLTQHPDIVAPLTAIAARLSAFQVGNRASPTGIGFDFTELEYEQLEELLLQTSGEIWLLILTCGDRDIVEALRCLVAKYTMPRPVLVSR
ncbi:MAG: hypothetical protein Q8S58_16065 [Bosea sp. (in: a-proteobacteria)]|uniref:hypothetical protein n=1 Tax=Bosea sp. (in: a-proteobacteria) TaxID=1871050 RepID=UPI00273563A0|nr:hypothetical protein [Bosea sp. (in: a-proteobacteria)]MDP3256207.1 hypothetical protein [Bosea sp. (in: a-proteobacteria)]MDP3320640.1 hypothetical protein [Bosea sp. (in: a-proteobacteria)]